MFRFLSLDHQDVWSWVMVGLAILAALLAMFFASQVVGREQLQLQLLAGSASLGYQLDFAGARTLLQASIFAALSMAVLSAVMALWAFFFPAPCAAGAIGMSLLLWVFAQPPQNSLNASSLAGLSALTWEMTSSLPPRFPGDGTVLSDHCSGKRRSAVAAELLNSRLLRCQGAFWDGIDRPMTAGDLRLAAFLNQTFGDW